jgi:hypothetical protein
MRWQFKVSLLFLVVSQVVFFVLAAYHMDRVVYYPEGDLGASPSVGYSWIWYHSESWMISLVLIVAALAAFVWGMIAEIRQTGWKLSDYIKIEIVEEEEN